jgi:organic radical activating enzyme
MIAIEKITKIVREEGFNAGLPMTSLRVGLGDTYDKVEDLIGEIIKFTGANKWILISGDDPLQTGMGSFIKGLRSCGLKTELRCEGSLADPGWMNSVDRWCVEYVDEPLFNYNALRSQDMVTFTVVNLEQLEVVKRGFEVLHIFQGLKYIRVINHTCFSEYADFVSHFDKARLFRC